MHKLAIGMILVFGLTIAVAYKRQYSLRANAIQWQTKESATPVEEGVMSEKEKIHSRKFSKYATGRKIRDRLAAEPDSEITVIYDASTPFIASLPGCPRYPSPGIVGQAQSADVIIIATIKNKTLSQLTDNEEFLFSNYEVIVDKIIKNKSDSPLRENQNITISRPGGAVQIASRIVRAIDRSFMSFEQGERYVLFLRYISETQDFQAFAQGSYLLRNGNVTSLFKGRDVKSKEADFVTEIRDALSATPCQSRGLN